MMKNKVQEYIVEPLNEWFGKNLTDGQARVYHDVLSGYNVAVLQDAMGELKATWSTYKFPMAAAIKAICEKTPTGFVALPAVEKRVMPNDIWKIAEMVIPTEVGKKALQESWAYSLIMTVMQKDSTDITDDDVASLRRGKRAAVEEVKKLENHQGAWKEGLMSMWWTFQEREQQILDRYRYLI